MRLSQCDVCCRKRKKAIFLRLGEGRGGKGRGRGYSTARHAVDAEHRVIEMATPNIKQYAHTETQLECSSAFDYQCCSHGHGDRGETRSTYVPMTNRLDGLVVMRRPIFNPLPNHTRV